MTTDPHPSSQDESLHRDAPRFTAKLGRYPSGVHFLKFKCPYCRRFHMHGGPIGGHRAAHCTNLKSPLRATGYWLEVAA